MDSSKENASLARRWREARLKKVAAFWACAASAVVTVIVGFAWGGWVTGGTAATMAEASGQEALLKRLTPICVLQFKQDPKKAQKLAEFQEVSSWLQTDYVKKQGWATIPGETEADGNVAEACAKLLR
jgi:hypothetical protein